MEYFLTLRSTRQAEAKESSRKLTTTSRLDLGKQIPDELYKMAEAFEKVSRLTRFKAFFEEFTDLHSLGRFIPQSFPQELQNEVALFACYLITHIGEFANAEKEKLPVGKFEETCESNGLTAVTFDFNEEDGISTINIGDTERFIAVTLTNPPSEANSGYSPSISMRFRQPGEGNDISFVYPLTTDSFPQIERRDQNGELYPFI